MKAVILIAVRMKSSRLPRKALALIEGKPLIRHLIERLKIARRISAIILCTSTHAEDGVLVEIARDEGIGWYRGDPDDVLLRFIGAAEQEGADVVVRVTGDNPLTDPEYIDRMVEAHAQAGADYTHVEGLPRGTRPEVVSVAALRRAHALAEDPRWSEYMTHYLRRPDVFRVHTVPADRDVWRPDYRLTVDVPEDLRLLREVYARLYGGGRIFPLREVIDVLDRHPWMVALNASIIESPPDPRMNCRLREVPVPAAGPGG
ncbi:MAG: glycosyltransferase family protein [Deltaproteobacteria bacterium]|nr:glycosyltransferase family protein [Deltaproteobacteria bacterium]